MKTMRVELDVGGKRFATTRTTLRKSGHTFFVRLADSDADVIFVDRDPTHFRIVLNYLRDCQAVLPTTQIHLLEIEQEARFYCLEELARAAGTAARRPEENFLQDIARTLQSRLP